MVAIAKGQELKVKTKLTYEEFLEICPKDGKYELVDGELVAVANTRQHENIVAFIYKKFDREIDRLSLDFVVRQNVSIKTNKINGLSQGRVPDISVIDRNTWYSNPSDYSSLIEPIQLAIEVVSTNWTDDYIEKFDEYQRLGIPEYWIVDYKAIASREFLGNSKIPTIFVNLLDANGKYQTSKFTGEAIVKSKTFPELGLTAAQILNI
ncbi:MAG: Uma2 family endonuclease [Pseudanabaena sp. M135S2SP2A07QC]|nr:Uma2 family endonuclease [Pseudanabaena sp. M090S1SP2A07QC]MCA6507138.1 Uma2 family endonuclease [Pseudanabaena sp. M172S2SP2A07QC]MCA6522624.1 Uma2 family endonuclease [Pseudanabaena sp. M051S1SP2A07QC]MCA6526168.1 Uma2 family endonuclease [Pseudanabaena sp. M179S2SP2A07QC]MCA6530591.1 Uma2 family endonuclease [Pseudanabaena sp. M125S2SP2A07QC]MCA6535728.1 Uma2 family endonuclease [Pseudanabaena sp. M176S2SP2A07QC]MCA6539695.1 Uma2 family endonuclease [Pseudanabaena sp. M037S2SP2A07QC]MC